MRVKKISDTDYTLAHKLRDEDGYIILLSLIGEINEYANQINSIVATIEILEESKRDGLDANKITCIVSWINCTEHDKSIKKLNLKEAKKLYKEIKVKYDVLYNVFSEAARIHYKENKEELINKYFSDLGTLPPV